MMTERISGRQKCNTITTSKANMMPARASFETTRLVIWEEGCYARSKAAGGRSSVSGVGLQRFSQQPEVGSFASATASLASRLY